jgi:hemerythrin
MAVAEWRDEYRTGHTTIDSQHRRLFTLVNQIHELTKLPEPPMAEIKHLLIEFADCAIAHFDLEETLMAQYAYPNLKVHCGTHQALVNKVQTLLHKFDHASGASTADVTQVLADWMVHHIRGEDRQMIRFFQQRQVGDVEALARP